MRITKKKKKIINQNKITNSKKQKKRSLRHPNCVLFLGFTSAPKFCIITEYLSHGSLRSLLSNKRIRITSKHIIKFALSIARGMNYLHTQSPAILHRDLTSHNILCHDNWTIKVINCYNKLL